MANIDSIEEIKSLDKQNVLSSIQSLGKQIKQVSEDFESIDLPDSLKGAHNIVVSGMGGSALGGRIVDSLILDKVGVPIEIFNEFHLPNYADENTLVIVSSYSGNTEETVLSLNDAIQRNLKIFVISTGGKLAEIAKEKNLPSYIFNPSNNPSNQPRMGLGYSISAILTLLAKLGYAEFIKSELENVPSYVDKFTSLYDATVNSSTNIAKQLASKIYTKSPVLVASEHLVGVTHAFKNQLNENAKTFTTIFDIPELNHHLMEGLANPTQIKSLLLFVFVKSKLYSEKVQKRYHLTLEVVEKNGIETQVIELISETKLEQVFELLVLGSYINFYVAMLYNIDPAPIPWVDYFKANL
ncbi:SIS domain-containing protein [Candidatus Microgenomates bacterium]|nr:SIS domain-containing protein [Candidatus Microgenomates bacterium]